MSCLNPFLYFFYFIFIKFILVQFALNKGKDILLGNRLLKIHSTHGYLSFLVLPRRSKTINLNGSRYQFLLKQEV